MQCVNAYNCWSHVSSPPIGCRSPNAGEWPTAWSLRRKSFWARETKLRAGIFVWPGGPNNKHEPSAYASGHHFGKRSSHLSMRKLFFTLNDP